MSFELDNTPDRLVDIKVVGVGGGGNNVVNRMIDAGVRSAEFVAINTDKQVLGTSRATYKIQIGEKITGGKGAGNDPEVGRKSMEESRSQVSKILENTDMTFVTAGMGGGTGTGAAPIVADVSRELGCLTVGVVTKPFGFEGTHRMRQAEAGIEELRSRVDSLIIIPNDRLKKVSAEKITFANAFRIADDVLKQAVQSIADIISTEQVMNLDFADVCAVMKDAGYAHIGVGRGSGKNKAEEAARMAIQSPLLETTIDGAKGVIICITGDLEITMEEVELAADMVRKAVHHEANVIFGASFNESMEDEIQVTVIATGFDETILPNEGDSPFRPAAQHQSAPSGNEAAPSGNPHAPHQQAPNAPPQQHAAPEQSSKDDDPFQAIYDIFNRK